jgi:hypothetical protein
MRHPPREKGSDSGAAMVEFAVVFALLLTIALGAFEYGMLFRDWLSVTVSAREGARVGASAGTIANADCIILEASAGALQSLSSGEVEHIAIYRSSPPGNFPGNTSSSTKRYRPANAETPDLVCSGGSGWIVVNDGGAWDPGDRDNEGTDADWIGVRVEFSHDWLTDFLWFSGTASFTDDAVFRMEPPAPS